MGRGGSCGSLFNVICCSCSFNELHIESEWGEDRIECGRDYRNTSIESGSQSCSIATAN